MVIRCRILVAKNLLDITTAPRLQMAEKANPSELALATPRPATRRATNRRATSTPPLPPAVGAGLEVCRRLKLHGHYGQGVGCADQRSHRGPVPALFCQASAKICHRQVLMQGCQRIDDFPSTRERDRPAAEAANKLFSNNGSAYISAASCWLRAACCVLLAALRQTCFSRSSEHV